MSAIIRNRMYVPYESPRIIELISNDRPTKEDAEYVFNFVTNSVVDKLVIGSFLLHLAHILHFQVHYQMKTMKLS
jgi:hypothetical protein